MGCCSSSVKSSGPVSLTSDSNSNNSSNSNNQNRNHNQNQASSTINMNVSTLTHSSLNQVASQTIPATSQQRVRVQSWVRQPMEHEGHDEKQPGSIKSVGEQVDERNLLTKFARGVGGVGGMEVKYEDEADPASVVRSFNLSRDFQVYVCCSFHDISLVFLSFSCH